jgi:hypothetical protein
MAGCVEPGAPKLVEPEFHALKQSRVAKDRAVFMDYMRGQHGKSLTYQLSASVPRT